MCGINRSRLLLMCASLATTMGIAVGLGWAFGFDGGMLFPIAIGLGTTLAIASGRRRACSPREQ